MHKMRFIPGVRMSVGIPQKSHEVGEIPSVRKSIKEGGPANAMVTQSSYYGGMSNAFSDNFGSSGGAFHQ